MIYAVSHIFNIISYLFSKWDLCDDKHMYIGHCVSSKSQPLPNMQQAYSVPVQQVNQFGDMHGAQQSQSMNNMCYVSIFNVNLLRICII